MIGHFGVTNSEGMIYDFGGDFYVNRSETHTIFGPPTLYSQLSDTCWSELSDDEWDNAISVATAEYQGRRYGFFTNNCHHFVATVLRTVSSGQKRYTVCSLIRRFRLGKAVKKMGDYTRLSSAAGEHD